MPEPGADLDDVFGVLEDEGIQKFADSWDEFRESCASSGNAEMTSAKDEQHRSVSSHGADAAAITEACLRPPLYATYFHDGFGTLYTAKYQAAEGIAPYHWPGHTWEHSLDKIGPGDRRRPSPDGGLGSAVVDALIDAGPADVAGRHLTVRELPGSGTSQELLDAADISAGHVAAAAPNLASQPGFGIRRGGSGNDSSGACGAVRRGRHLGR